MSNYVILRFDPLVEDASKNWKREVSGFSQGNFPVYYSQEKSFSRSPRLNGSHFRVH